MNKIFNEMKKHPWCSPFQLGVGGLMIFMIAIIVGPHYGCGAGNISNAFTCVDGPTAFEYKAFIVLCIVISSLCWGRAVSLFEQRGSLNQ